MPQPFARYRAPCCSPKSRIYQKQHALERVPHRHSLKLQLRCYIMRSILKGTPAAPAGTLPTDHSSARNPHRGWLDAVVTSNFNLQKLDEFRNLFALGIAFRMRFVLVHCRSDFESSVWTRNSTNTSTCSCATTVAVRKGAAQATRHPRPGTVRSDSYKQVLFLHAPRMHASEPVSLIAPTSGGVCCSLVQPPARNRIAEAVNCAIPEQR